MIVPITKLFVKEEPAMNTNPRLRQMVTAALFAAVITVVTAYFLHIPIPGSSGYVHLGDTLIYMAACLLPAPYAIFAASVGAGLADLLTAPAWVLPTVLIKAVVALQFTCKRDRILVPRNVIAVFTTMLVSPTLYSLAYCVMTGTMAAFVPQFAGTIVQAIGSAIVFLPLAVVLDRMGFKTRIARNLAAAA